jgi:proteasome lid subunit RPN8/RPN11
MQNAPDQLIVSDRSAETAYVFGAKDLLDLSRSFDTDTPARIIYHSHPNGRAYFSPTDREVALGPWGGEPAFPVQQLVIGIDTEAVQEAALFAWSYEEEGFMQIARFEGAAV